MLTLVDVPGARLATLADGPPGGAASDGRHSTAKPPDSHVPALRAVTMIVAGSPWVGCAGAVKTAVIWRAEHGVAALASRPVTSATRAASASMDATNTRVSFGAATASRTRTRERRSTSQTSYRLPQSPMF